METKTNIDLIIDNYTWCNVKVSDAHVVVGMYEDGKVAKSLFQIDREQARQLVKILDAFAHEWL